MNMDHEVAVLEHTSTNDLKRRFAEVCGYATGSRNRTWLIRRIAWHLQASAEGGLSERARARAAELAEGALLRATAPTIRRVASVSHDRPPAPQERPTAAPVANATARRLPIPGSVIVRPYKGRDLRVKVLEQGLEFEGEVFKSLSAVAKHITGSHCNGYLFFRLSGGDR
jgi:hypothetical protein